VTAEDPEDLLARPVDPAAAHMHRHMS
jgi:hypothetical protein